MKRLIATLWLTFAMLLGGVWGCRAGGNSYKAIDSEKIIEQCWKISEEDRGSGVNSNMIDGAGKSIDCLESAIVENMVPLLGLKRREEIKNIVADFVEATGKLSFPIFNEVETCSPNCGTMYIIMPMGVTAKFLEKILHDVISQRNEYQM